MTDHGHEHGSGHQHGHEHGSGHQHGHEHGSGHQHGHEHDRGWRGTVRYLRLLPKMWSNEVNDYVIETLDLGPGSTAVDIGAGMGAGVVPAARRGASVVAVDPTPFMLRMLRLRRLLQRNRTSITVADGAAERLPLDDGVADVVWAVNAMHHWQDLDAAAGEIARVLAPGGRVLLIDEDFLDPDHEYNQKDPGQAERRRAKHGMDPVGAAQMAEALTAVGMTEVQAVDKTIAPHRPIKQATAVKPVGG